MGRVKLTGGLLGIMLLASVLMFGVLGEVSAETVAATETLDLKINDTDGMAKITADQVTEEPAKYNLASAQRASSLQVVPGGEAKGALCFYNVDGNRVTHITLEVVQAPKNWEVEIAPPLDEVEVESGGQVISVTENLYAEPTELSPEPIEDVPEGMVCLTLSNRGYALAKVVSIIIRVPESEEVGTEGDIKIVAVASWLGQTGVAAINQSRHFDFNVKLTPERRTR